MKKLRVLVLCHEDQVPPETLEGLTQQQVIEFKAGHDVITTLRGMGHQVRPLGVHSDLGVIRDAIDDWKPHICFNLLEEFHGISVYDQHVISFLELLRQPYTGCNPRGLLLTHDKALHKQILSYHRIRVPKFTVFPRGRRIRASRKLSYPLFVKSLTEEGSYGISQASIVHTEDKLVERVRYLHEQLGTAAIAEEYVEGREIYVAITGNRRLRTYPLLELVFGKMPEGAPHIATSKVKWDWKYQEEREIQVEVVRDLSPEIDRRIRELGKRIFRALSLSGYARIDLRLTPENEVYVLEANPNADISIGEEMWAAAEAAGMDYPDLLQHIINLGRNYQAEWKLV